ncbi:MAG: nucleotide exchange factor GrpE [Rhodothermales bacterium]|nr:nucleotide exchange factor GrpE [Rhodothermales bacterium]MBO6780737.1 nucleotide exchange factor GrpE [Rhodothermales bacterium]
MEELDKEIENAMDGAATEEESLEARLARQEEELGTLRDQVMRQAAEFQNYRRRTEQEKVQMADYGRQDVVTQLLDVLDDFRRTLDAAGQVENGEVDEAAFKSLHTGVAMVYGKLLGELAKLGVEQIDAVGKPFDEAEHEALMSQPVSDGQEPGHVVGEIQAGYRMGDRVIRHARVVVTA